MKIQNEQPQSTRKRGTYLGGHHVAALIGVHPYTSPDEVMQEWLHPKKTEPTAAMVRGLVYENYFLDKIEKDNFREFKRRDVFLQSGQFGGSIDAICEETESIIEITTCNNDSKDNDRSYKHWQCQWYMFLSGIERAEFYICNVDTLAIEMQVIHKDDACIKRLLDAAMGFFEAVAFNDELPKEKPAEKKPKAEPVKIDDEETRNLLVDFHSDKKRMKALQEASDILRARVESLALKNGGAVESAGIIASASQVFGKPKTDWESVAREAITDTKQLNEIARKHTQEAGWHMRLTTKEAKNAD